MTGLPLLVSACLPIVAGDGTPLSLDDLPPYRAALEATATEQAVAAGFGDLWKDPGAYRGRRIQVSGRVERRFRQPALGTFPPLVELWIVAEGRGHNPICLVFPEVAGTQPPVPGNLVRFTGTFLKLLSYPSGDGARIAPLIVGGNPPVKTTSAPAQVTKPLFSGLDWIMGVIVAVIVLFVLAHQHLRRPLVRQTRHEPPPEFAQEPLFPRHVDEP